MANAERLGAVRLKEAVEQLYKHNVKIFQSNQRLTGCVNKLNKKVEVLTKELEKCKKMNGL